MYIIRGVSTEARRLRTGHCFAGIAANMPVALAPGMGLNAYFAYQVPPPEFLLLLSYIFPLVLHGLCSNCHAMPISKVAIHYVLQSLGSL